MLYALYAGTFFYNVLFYMMMLRQTAATDLVLYNAAFMLLCSGGMVLYGLAHEKLSPAMDRRALQVSLLANAVSIGLISTMGGHLFLWFALFAFAIAFGYLSACIAHQAACLIPYPQQGQFIGISLALANFSLYFALSLPDGGQVLLMLAAVLLAFFLLRKIPAHAPLPPVLSDTRAAEVKKNLPLAVLIVTALGVLVGLDDSIFIPHFAEYEASYFGISRLYTAGGFLLAGFLADRFPFYLPLIAIAAKSVPLFVRAGSSEFLLSLLAYTDAFFTGALIVLVIRLFFFIAPYTRRPALWAGMGRGIEMPASGLAALWGTLYLESASMSMILAVHAAMLLFCALLFYHVLIIYARTQKARPLTAGNLMKNDINPINTLTANELSLAANISLPMTATQEGCPLDSLRKTYDLTDRETEVLGEVLQEKSIADIAAALFVTERTVKYHIGNLLKKTACKNQKELREKIQG